MDPMRRVGRGLMVRGPSEVCATSCRSPWNDFGMKLMMKRRGEMLLRKRKDQKERKDGR